MEPPVLLAWLGAVLSCSACSGLDVETPTVFRGDADAAFGHSVAQFAKGVLVGAPLQRGNGGKLGAVYRCQHPAGTCQEVPVTGPPRAVNASLGLAVAAGDRGVLACGPTVPQTCGQNIQLNGFCVLLDPNSDLRQLQSFPAALPECPKSSSDVALLVDGSGSISSGDFGTMKKFIQEVMKRFKGTDTQFSLTQFSNKIVNHFDFNTFRRYPDPDLLLTPVEQLHGATFTATAISRVLQEMFLPSKGAREGATRILIVVTDGQKYGDSLQYPDVIPLAEKMRVTRYAIGVGRAFSHPEAVAELHSIASHPPQDHVFQVDNFDALQGIQNQLQEKIFAIEGTQTSDSSSFQLEMAQEGFSALLTPEGPVLGAVGAYDWSGGVFVYSGGGDVAFVNVSRGARDLNNAYLGYAAESLSLGGFQALALGAPRHQHVGRILLFQRRSPQEPWELLAEAEGTQVGSYFGASLSALDTDGDGGAELLLVGSPMFYGAGSGGLVDVCSLRVKGGRLRCQQRLRGQPGHPLGRFGATLARLGDLDGDRWPEVAVGAPLEDEERGAVYIFRGQQGGLDPQYSQRISGSHFSSLPRHLGRALSGGRDLSGDRLPDVAVGAQGLVLLLRSPPVLKLKVTVTFQPREIPVAALGCQEDGETPGGGDVAKATFCFLLTKKTPDNFGSHLSTTLSYQATLDPGRVTTRGGFSGGGSVLNRTLTLRVGRSCQTVAVTLTGCPRDTLTPLGLRLTHEARGVPVEVAGGLRPVLSRDSQMVALGTLPFERDCGSDNICVDDLRVSFNFSGLESVVVGDTDVVPVTVALSNRGEASYGATVRIQHPPALSYRKGEILQSSRRSPSLHCHSEPPSEGLRWTLCQVNHPILRPGAEVVFSISLDVPTDAELGGTLQLVANASSDNGVPGGRGHREELPVKYGVLLLVLAGSPDSTRYLNITSGGSPPPPSRVPITHHYEVKNLGQRSLPINVTFLLPADLGGGSPLWQHLNVTPDQELAQCQGPVTSGDPQVPPQFRGVPLLELRCWVQDLEPSQTLGFRLGGQLALDWLLKGQQPRGLLQSWARVLYDERRYCNRGGAPHVQMQTELERLETPNPLPLILGGSVGGLLLLGLVALLLYKVGFFKRPYKEMLEGDGTPTTPLGDPQE